MTASTLAQAMATEIHPLDAGESVFSAVASQSMEPDRTSQESPKTPPPPPPAAPPPPVPGAPGLGVEPHCSIVSRCLYKYRWASIAVFLLVIGWVMVDSYTAVPMYQRRRARAD
jgi:hypothetical protein